MDAQLSAMSSHRIFILICFSVCLMMQVQCNIRSTCIVPSVAKGEMARVTCTYDADVVAENIRLEYFPNASVFEDAAHLYCRQASQDLPERECLPDTLTFNFEGENGGSVNFTFTASKDREGQYSCLVIPEEEGMHTRCDFTLKAEEAASSTEASSTQASGKETSGQGENDAGGDITGTIVGVIAGLLVAAFVAVVGYLKREWIKKKVCGSSDSAQLNAEQPEKSPIYKGPPPPADKKENIPLLEQPISKENEDPSAVEASESKPSDDVADSKPSDVPANAEKC